MWWYAGAAVFLSPLLPIFLVPAIQSSPLVSQSLKDALNLLRSPGLLGWQAVVAVGFSITLVRHARQFAMFRMVRELGPQNICTECAYDLTALDEEGTCPECGHAYIKSSNDLLWTRQVASPPPRALRSER